MNLSCGIVGLPNVGKSTLFNALLSKQTAEASNYPFCTIEPNIGVVSVPDNRLKPLAEIVQTQKIVPSVVKFVDIAGIIKGASQGEGLGNKFLSHIREVSVIIHLLRNFTDADVVQTGISPQDDYSTITTELCLADLQTLEKQQEPRGIKDKQAQIRWQGIIKLREALVKGKEARFVELTTEEQETTKDLFLLSAKPEIVVLNIDEKDYSNQESIAEKHKQYNPVIISAKIEAELAEMNMEEQKVYLKELGVEQSGLEKLIQKAYQTLGLMSFLTAGEKEVRAWTIEKGTKAPQAAGVIHTDFEKKFIKANIASYNDFINFQGWKGLREAGKMRIEGKDYVMKENDVVEFMIGK